MAEFIVLRVQELPDVAGVASGQIIKVDEVDKDAALKAAARLIGDTSAADSVYGIADAPSIERFTLTALPIDFNIGT